jgi:uncharacterized protein YbjT (DUF2867 family)
VAPAEAGRGGVAECGEDFGSEVAVAALTEDGHVGQLYEVTGPRLLTWADAVAEIATAGGGRASHHRAAAARPWRRILLEA